MPSPALPVPLAVNQYHNKLEPNVPNNTLRHPSFCYLNSFSIVSVTPFIYKPDSSIDLIIFIIPFISSLEVIDVVLPDPNIFL